MATPQQNELLARLSTLSINGDWAEAASGDTFEVVNPSTEEVLTTVSDGGIADVRDALASAETAFDEWANTPLRARAEILRRAYEIMIERKDELAWLISAENGKSLSDGAGEVVQAAEFFRWFSEEGIRPSGEYSPVPGAGFRKIVTRRPVGVVGLITPWNFPMSMATRKIAPALAAGCTAVLKPAKLTPLSSLAIAEVLNQAGLPSGAVNVVPTTDANGITDEIINRTSVRMISFTGSTSVGKLLMRKSAERVLNTGMELGGNAPFIVTENADVDAAVEGAMIAKFRNAGQACTAANRFLVHESVAGEFTEKFVARVKDLVVGVGTESTTQIGPVISAGAANGINELVERSVAQGARVAFRAEIPTTGYFVAPTVLVDVPRNAEVFQNEIFGPVAPIATYRDEADVIAAANDTEYGLTAYLYEGELRHAISLAERIEAGMVGINRGLVSEASAPFGGFKQSGIGREASHEGLEEFQETQYYAIDWQ